MGCGSSARIFMVDETIPGQNSEAIRSFKLLELSDDDIEKFYLSFKKFDIVGNDLIEIDEFLPRLGLEKNRVSMEVFSDIDRNHDSKINFQEFVLSSWKYIAKGKKDLAEFAFDIYDTDNSEYLSEDEVINMVAELYGTKRLEDGTRKLIKKMDRDKNGRISRKEFVASCKIFPQLMHPAFDIQATMRRKIIGESFWVRKEKYAIR